MSLTVKKKNAAARAAFRADPNGILEPGMGGGCKISKHEKGVLKSGSRVTSTEYSAMLMAHRLGIPVPEVLETKHDETGFSFVMEFVDGDCLEDVWPGMSPEEKLSIAQQLRKIISTMRVSRTDQGSISSMGHPVRDLRQYTEYNGGPFATEAEFNEFILDLVKTTPPAIRSALAGSLETGHRIVFTHGDLTPRNIIVRDGQISGLIDWEFSGWYPEYWEYVKFFDRPTACRDWKEYASEIFETQYPKHLVTFQALARWQNP